jgi:hypothetical protein
LSFFYLGEGELEMGNGRGCMLHVALGITRRRSTRLVELLFGAEVIGVYSLFSFPTYSYDAPPVSRTGLPTQEKYHKLLLLFVILIISNENRAPTHEKINDSTLYYSSQLDSLVFFCFLSIFNLLYYEYVFLLRNANTNNMK